MRPVPSRTSATGWASASSRRVRTAAAPARGGVPLRIEVECHVAIERLCRDRPHACWRRRRRRSRSPGAAVRESERVQLDRRASIVDADPLLRRIGRSGDVAASVLIGQLSVAFNRQRLDREQTVAAAERHRRAGNDVIATGRLSSEILPVRLT